jgi:HPt (histidine-containing phosphotransfer) domain-containing protein
VNAVELLQRIDGDRTLLAELVEVLRAEYPGQLRNLRESIARGDASAVERVGHALRGALGNLSATSASGFAAELESIGRSGNLALARSKLMELENEMHRVMETLDALIDPNTRVATETRGLPSHGRETERPATFPALRSARKPNLGQTRPRIGTEGALQR